MYEAAAYREGAVLPEASGKGRSAVWGCIAAGLAIRIYLGLTSFCISGDGAAYIRLAQDYAAGAWRKPLGAVFSPLYPLLIAGMHAPGMSWELSGNLVSGLAGAAAIGTIYLLINEVFGDQLIALGAAALMAIHPDLAAYGASVRTEAGYILLTTAAVWLLLSAVRQSSAVYAMAAGAIAGLAYLYRTEAVVLLGLMAIFPLAAAMVWRALLMRAAVRISAAFTVAALIFVAPYAVMLHAVTGHWTVGREFTAAIMYGIGNSSPDTAYWRNLGFAASASPLRAIMAHPQIYLAKVAKDFAMSLYGFVEAAGTLAAVLLAIGLWRRRAVFEDYREAFLAVIILAYFGAFTLTATGPRFMIHLIPFAFGWVIIGLMRVTDGLQAFARNRRWSLPGYAPALACAVILLPQTLWPIGYDMRGVRYAGEAIAAANSGRGAVIARDGRVAWYAQAPFVALPVRSTVSLCEWIGHQARPAYLLIGERDEQHFGVPRQTPCLTFLKRYPRYGKGYYDLYAVRGAGESPR